MDEFGGAGASATNRLGDLALWVWIVGFSCNDESTPEVLPGRGLGRRGGVVFSLGECGGVVVVAGSPAVPSVEEVVVWWRSIRGGGRRGGVGDSRLSQGARLMMGVVSAVSHLIVSAWELPTGFFWQCISIWV